MEMESIGIYILERLLAAHESWTDPKYGDNPDEAALIRLLRRNLKDEANGAFMEFIKQINTSKEK
jgi:hypothetical protein